MKFAAFCVVLALSACSSDSPVGPSTGSESVLESSGKAFPTLFHLFYNKINQG